MSSIRFASVVILFATFSVLLLGCWGPPHDGPSTLQGSDPATDEQPNTGDTHAIIWSLGPVANGDTAQNIVFRETSKSTRSNGVLEPNVVLPRPMIQGAPEALFIDGDGNQYVGGSFSGNKDFDTGPGVDFHEAVGAEDGFVTCFDRDGKYCWTKTFGAKERIDVQGITVSHGVVYAVCNDREGRVAILAVDSATGTPRAEFGHSGCQMFRCGQFDFAAGIRSLGDTIYVAIRCVNILAGKLPPLAAGEKPPAIAWPDYSFTIVLAIDRTTGSAVTSFGTNGVQTIGNAVALTGPPSAKVANTKVEPFGLALSGSTIYVFGRCSGNSLGIAGHGSIIGEPMRSKGFIAALNLQTGTAASGFGPSGVVLMEGNVKEVADADVVGHSLYAAGYWDESSSEKAFLAVMDAETGELSQDFGAAGIRVFGPWAWQGGWSIRVNGQVVYIAGGYILGEETERVFKEGVFVAAFDRTKAFPVVSFGDKGVRLIEGPEWGEQGRIEPFGDTLFLVARTEPSLEMKNEIRVGDTILEKGEIRGFMFRLSKDGKVLNK